MRDVLAAVLVAVLASCCALVAFLANINME